MKTMTWTAAAVATSLLFACGSGSHGDFTGSNIATSSGGGSGAAAGSSGGSPGDSSTGPNLGDLTEGGGADIPAEASVKTNGYDADVPDAELEQPLTLTMSPFTVPPNSEV